MDPDNIPDQSKLTRVCPRITSLPVCKSRRRLYCQREKQAAYHMKQYQLAKLRNEMAAEK